MTGESIESNSVTTCTFISNGLTISPRSSKFDSPHEVIESLSYTSVSDISEPSIFISEISYIDVFPVSTSIQPSTTSEKTKNTKNNSTSNHYDLMTPALIRNSDKVAELLPQ